MTASLLLALAASALPIIPAGALTAQEPEYRFSRAMRAGETLAIGNIDGAVTVTRASGNNAVVLVTKRVIRGNGDLVKAILEEEGSGRIKVCTVYLREAGQDRNTCRGDNDSNYGRRRDPLEVEMTYEVQLPSGVQLDVGTVDGDVMVSGLSARSSLSTVDGNIRVEGRAPERVSTVDGDIEILAAGELPAELRYSTVDGGVLLTLPGDAGFEVNATTVDGGLESDFPITVQGRWGPRSLRGRVGDGRTSIRISTVDGAVAIRRR
jgi:hypothetical protein